ncbi:hypothetical protein UFOVP1106_39 [uncultured Caudovirales phage]|uniref:Uncharacterized protein n=1 Tax=uncultured Caudovirales phage TaxID=2100421 RepID=A0A6J5QQA0_9CAUD|nr:hypothetical protein UFOVP1106_39 [uncultured Caudovirales phage]
MFLTALFEMIKTAFAFGTKAIPTDKMREEKQTIHVQRLTLQEKDKILNESILFLDLHPRLMPDDYVNWKFDLMDFDDISEIRKLLSQRYANRIKRSLKYKQ